MAGVGAVLVGTSKERSVFLPPLWSGGISGLWGGQLVLRVGEHPAFAGGGWDEFSWEKVLIGMPSPLRGAHLGLEEEMPIPWDGC